MTQLAASNRNCWEFTEGDALPKEIFVNDGRESTGTENNNDYYEIFVQELKPAANHSKSIYAIRKGPNVIGYWHNPNIEPTVHQFFFNKKQFS